MAGVDFVLLHIAVWPYTQIGRAIHQWRPICWFPLLSDREGMSSFCKWRILVKIICLKTRSATIFSYSFIVWHKFRIADLKILPCRVISFVTRKRYCNKIFTNQVERSRRKVNLKNRIATNMHKRKWDLLAQVCKVLSASSNECKRTSGLRPHLQQLALPCVRVALEVCSVYCGWIEHRGSCRINPWTVEGPCTAVWSAVALWVRREKPVFAEGRREITEETHEGGTSGTRCAGKVLQLPFTFLHWSSNTSLHAAYRWCTLLCKYANTWSASLLNLY